MSRNPNHNYLPICPYCHRRVGKESGSWDHIMPKSRIKHLGLRNPPFPLDSHTILLRYCHRSCNNLLEQAGECIGALACAEAVVSADGFATLLRRRRAIGWILRKWGLMNNKDTDYTKSNTNTDTKHPTKEC
jgi:hypothetical protein